MLIVTYHAIVAPFSPVCCPPAQFEADLTGLVDAGYTFVSLDQCADWLSGGRPLPARSIAVTFDDGYASVVASALPLLTRMRVPATLFVVGGRIGGDNQWPGQWRSIPSMPLADLGQLKEAVAAGVTIGSHSSSHPFLPGLDSATLEREVEESARRLEELLESPVRHFAYPYGIRGAREIAAARRYYRTAVNAEPYVVTAAADPHDLSRIDCHDLHTALRLRVVDERVLPPYLALRRALRGVRRRVETLFDRR